MIQRSMYVLFAVLFSVISRNSYAQTYEVDTLSIREVITRWNAAHNQVSEDAFNELYASSILFYANELDKKVCLQKKLALLHRGSFVQRLGNDLHLLFYESGVVYCGFTKEVSMGGDTKSYPSYLLLKRFGDEYLITGESDLITDRNLKFNLTLGVQVPITALSYVSFPRKSQEHSSFWIRLAVLLFTAGVVVYFVSRRRVSTTRARKPSQKENGAPTPFREWLTTERPFETKKNTEDYYRRDEVELKKGHTFEHYVVERFKQRGEFFKWISATSDKGTRDYYPESNQYPDLHYEFRMGGKSYPFAVECKYRSMTTGTIKITNDGQIERYKKFGIEKKMEVFIVLGLGGKPEKPSELYVIPLDHLAQWMDKQTLQAYKAETRFYYRVSERRLY
ncbi:MAG: hypothetical protein JSS79_15480 [Bacteroidetes bacterium]|nr:hypothetical protein [Bacteroidota bacterium]